MSRHFDEVIETLRSDLLRMGGRAEAILDKSLRALWERDTALAEEVARDDVEIDRLEVTIDERVLKALALQAPVAEDLREVLAVKMIAVDLERVGDLSRNIARCAQRIAAHPEVSFPVTLNTLARAAQRVLRRSLDAFSHTDGDLARAVMDEDDAIDQAQDEVVQSMLRALERTTTSASQEVDLIMIAKQLVRVGDQATNIAEYVIEVAEARHVKHAEKLARNS
jgi:phosphate transport system protein